MISLTVPEAHVQRPNLPVICGPLNVDYTCADPISKKIQVGDKEYVVSCIELEGQRPDELKDWGVLRPTGDSNRWLCTTCTTTRTNCPHARSAKDVDEHQWSDETKERRFQEFFDPATGKRKLTCISRCEVPVVVNDSDHADEFRGVSLILYYLHSASMPSCT